MMLSASARMLSLADGLAVLFFVESAYALFVDGSVLCLIVRLMILTHINRAHNFVRLGCSAARSGANDSAPISSSNTNTDASANKDDQSTKRGSVAGHQTANNKQMDELQPPLDGSRTTRDTSESGGGTTGQKKDSLGDRWRRMIRFFRERPSNRDAIRARVAWQLYRCAFNCVGLHLTTIGIHTAYIYLDAGAYAPSWADIQLKMAALADAGGGVFYNAKEVVFAAEHFASSKFVRFLPNPDPLSAGTVLAHDVGIAVVLLLIFLALDAAHNGGGSVFGWLTVVTDDAGARFVANAHDAKNSGTTSLDASPQASSQ